MEKEYEQVSKCVKKHWIVEIFDIHSQTLKLKYFNNQGKKSLIVPLYLFSKWPKMEEWSGGVFKHPESVVMRYPSPKDFWLVQTHFPFYGKDGQQKEKSQKNACDWKKSALLTVGLFITDSFPCLAYLWNWYLSLDILIEK